MIAWLNQGGTVMWILLVLSLLSWFVILERVITLFFEWLQLKSCSKKIDSEGLFVLDEIKSSSSIKIIFSELGRKEKLSKEEYLSIARSLLKDRGEKLYRGMTFLEIAASISPLLGLLGTVLGMVEVFSVIAKVGIGDPGILSSGISKALNTTVFGLIVAIPAQAFYSTFRRKIEKIIWEIEKYLLKYMDPFLKEEA